MIKFLNFLYKGFAFSKPRFGIKETFWVLVFSLILSPIDVIFSYCIYFFTNANVDFLVFYLILTIIIRSIPLFFIKPFTSKFFSSLYVLESDKKYWLNAVIAFLFFIIFSGFPCWVGTFFILYNIR